ncbi:autotransporter outer membrane beta-barrel domain-containing protein [Pseudochrobactrum sp. MP213Fo]|uniref:autotransporter outer membrane beta-barrel domain-containing protein n=1 Tax=Pseudochrobactrum sp. MP213Fo TaxID=3022250 RepID=UPI003BA04A2A
MAASGGSGIVNTVGAGAPPYSNGGIGGVDGTADVARGQDGFFDGITSGGGGGGVDLTTGHGGAGGRQKIKGTVSNAPDAATREGDHGGFNQIDAGLNGGDGENGGNGIGGAGGSAAVSTNQDVTVSGTGIIIGGKGGSGGASSGGGGGGVGIFSSANVIVNSHGSVTGGGGGNGTGFGGGGGGAAAVVFIGAGTLMNEGALLGGVGGNARVVLHSAAGGSGGEGVLFTNGGTVINHAGASITGGAFGTNGTNIANFGVEASKGGAGIKGANVSVVNAGAISGGNTSAGSIADAITFTGGTNLLEIWGSSIIDGNVQAFSSADRFILGGADNGTFDVTDIGDIAQYRGFGNFEKTGASTWTLIDTTDAVTPWVLSGGTLSTAADGSLGDVSGGLTLNGGTLQTTDSFAMDRNISLINAGGTLDTVANKTLTINSIIDNTGSLTKTSAGTLILTADNSYTGGTIITGGSLQLGNGGASGSVKGNITNNGVLNVNRNNRLTIAGTVSGDGSLNQAGTGTTVLTADNSYTGGTTISGGILQLGDGGSSGSITGNVANSGALAFNRADKLIFAGMISGSGEVHQLGAGTTLLTGVNTYAGQTVIDAGTLSAGGENVLSASSAHSVASDGILDLAGNNQTIAALAHAGTVRLGGEGSRVGAVLTVTGDYTGNNGTIIFNAVLADDASDTDRLIIKGDTSGSTNLIVRNIKSSGGVTTEGIKIIQVGGTSDGVFSLRGDYVLDGDQAVISGAYAYRLYHNSMSDPKDGDWYLRSTLKDMPTTPTEPTEPNEPGSPLYNPAAPVYEAYASVLLHLNSVSTLQQRVGNRYWNGTTNAQLNGQSETSETVPAIWGRVEAAHSKFLPKASTSSTDYNIDIWKMQAGLDGLLYESAGGKLIGGITVHYSTATADVSSVFGHGKIDMNGYGFGSTLTWYGQNGFYVDGQAQATWYKSDLFSHDANQALANGNDAFGYVFSAETGQHFDLTQNWVLTPQAQLTYASVDFGSFTTVFSAGNANISLVKADSLRARLGVSADYQNTSLSSDGKKTRTNVYAIANFYHEFLDGTDVTVSGVSFASKNDRIWGGIGTGGSYNWANDKYSIYGEVSLNTSLSNFADSYSINGTAGFKVAF